MPYASGHVSHKRMRRMVSVRQNVLSVYKYLVIYWTHSHTIWVTATVKVLTQQKSKEAKAMWLLNAW